MAPKILKNSASAPPPMAPSVRKQRPVRDNPIIRQEVVGATTEAKKIIAEAEEEADRIIEEANEAARQTHEKGFEEGREQALAQFTQQTSEALLRIESMAQAIEPTYVGLIRHCVEKIIDGELRMHPDAIVGVVRNALRDARQQREIIVRVHPADVDALGKSKAKLLEMLARAQTVEIRGDESIRRGGCVVVTELGTIDASLDRQLEALEVALDTELREGGSGDYPEEAEESELDPEDDPGYGGRY